jgi:outer membrane protein assembly factor BamB
VRLLTALASVALPLAAACGSRTGLTIESTQPDASTPDAAAPIDMTCPGSTSVQPGAPWPTSRRCPTNAASSPGPRFVGTPHVQWSVPLVAPSAVGSPAFGQIPIGVAAIAADGTLYLATSDGLLALNPTGQLRWQALRGSYVESLFLGVDGTIYATTRAGAGAGETGAAVAVLPSGTTGWTFEAPCDAPLGILPDVDGDLYVLTDGCSAPSIMSIHAGGSVAWSWPLPGGQGFGPIAPAVGPDGTLYFTTNGMYERGALIAMSPTGKPAWSFSFPEELTDGNELLVGPDGTVYAAGPLSFGTMAVSAKGALLWAHHDCSAVAIGADGTIYAFSTSGLSALDPDGGLAWASNQGSGFLPVVGDDVVYVPVANLGVVALDTNGVPLWTLGGLDPRWLVMGEHSIYAIALTAQGSSPAFSLVSIGD